MGTWEGVGDKGEGNKVETMGRGTGSEEEVWRGSSRRGVFVRGVGGG